jgi:hypothetical protein
MKLRFFLVIAALWALSSSVAQAGSSLNGCWRSVGFGPSMQAPNHGDFGHIFCFNAEGDVKITGFMGHFITFKYGQYTESGSKIEFALKPDPTGITRVVWPAFAYSARCDLTRSRTNELAISNCSELQGSAIRGDIALQKMANTSVYPELLPPKR